MGLTVGTAAAIVGAGSAVAGSGLQFKAGRQQAGYYAQSAAMMARQQDYLRDSARFQEQALLSQAETARLNAESYRREAKMSLLAGEYNQTQAKREAIAIKRRAKARAAELAEQGGKAMGGQVVGYLASGLTLEGTPALVLAETDRKVKEDVANILEAGDYAALDKAEQGAMARIAGLAGAGRASVGAFNAWGEGLAALAGARHATGTGLAYQLYLNRMQAWATGSQAALARMGSWGTIFTGLGRTAGSLALGLGG